MIWRSCNRHLWLLCCKLCSICTSQATYRLSRLHICILQFSKRLTKQHIERDNNMSDNPTSSTTPTASTADLLSSSQNSFTLSTAEIVWLVVVIVVVVVASGITICVLCRCKVRRRRGNRKSRGTSVLDTRNELLAWNKNAPLADRPLPPIPKDIERSSPSIDRSPPQVHFAVQPPPAARIAQSHRQKDEGPVEEERRRSKYFSGWAGFDRPRKSLVGRAF